MESPAAAGLFHALSRTGKIVEFQNTANGDTHSHA